MIQSKDERKVKFEENSNYDENYEDFRLENNLKETLLERLHSHDHEDIYNEIYQKHSPQTIVEKSTFTKLIENIKPGITVGLVNLPLSVSLAVASGATPTAGILSGIASGFITGLFGGSNYNIVGPTGALSGFLMSSVIRYGINILPLYAIFTGIFTFLTGYFKLQEFIDLVPVPVNEGFTLGVAFTIFFNQMNSALGIGKFKDAIPLINKNNLNNNNLPSINNENLINSTINIAANSTIINNNPEDSYNMDNLNSELYQKVVNILDSGNSESLVHNIIMNINHINQMKWESFVMFLAFFIILLYLVTKHGRIPWMIISAIVGIIISQFTSGRIDTLQSKFGMLEFQFYNFNYLTDSKSNFFIKIFDIRTWIEALPIAFVAILETLISAKIADQLTNTKFDKKAELRSLGIANVLSGFLGGIPVTAALARTSLNIKSGGTHRLSSLVSSILMFCVSYFFMNYFSFIPMPVIAAQVCIVAVRLVNFEEVDHLYKHDKKNFYLFSIIVVISVIRDSIQAVLSGMLIYQIMFCKELTKPWTEIIKAKNLSSKDSTVPDSTMVMKKPSILSSVAGSNKKILRSFVMGNLRNLENSMNNKSALNTQVMAKQSNNQVRNSESHKQIHELSFNERHTGMAIKDGIPQSGYFKNFNNDYNDRDNLNNNITEEFKETDKIDVIDNPKKLGEENSYFNRDLNKNEDLNLNLISDKQESNKLLESSFNYRNFISQFEDVKDNNFFDIPKQEGNFIVYRIVGILNFMNVEMHISNINKLNLDPHSKIIISLRYVHLIDIEAINSLENIIKTVSENRENHYDEKDIKILISGITRTKLNLIKKSKFIQKLIEKNAILLVN